MRRLLLLPLALLALSGCGDPLKAGEVIGKQHSPATTFVMIIPMCTSTGKSTVCTPIPYFMYDDEDWTLRLRDCVGAGKDRHCREGTVYVDPATFADFEVGEQFGGDPAVQAQYEDQHERRGRAG